MSPLPKDIEWYVGKKVTIAGELDQALLPTHFRPVVIELRRIEISE